MNAPRGDRVTGRWGAGEQGSGGAGERGSGGAGEQGTRHSTRGPGDQGTRSLPVPPSPLACPRVGVASAKRLGGGLPVSPSPRPPISPSHIGGETLHP
ncbi:hypothetical protein [[Phormidium] sp. ETS-05]|uniref:hypothetical protein n=1 Tax=[Phormidium] sp. ETS-05 TaxID=222819 RepID=UPI001E30B8E5|nr:hypothetical protein [[Phormidium] sp. ETS-05]